MIKIIKIFWKIVEILWIGVSVITLVTTFYLFHGASDKNAAEIAAYSMIFMFSLSYPAGMLSQFLIWGGVVWIFKGLIWILKWMGKIFPIIDTPSSPIIDTPSQPTDGYWSSCLIYFLLWTVSFLFGYIQWFRLLPYFAGKLYEWLQGRRNKTLVNK